MTDLHPITPPSELIEEWIEIAKPLPQQPPNPNVLATYAACWGADHQLELDAKWLDTNALYTQNLTISPSGNALRKVMRPKPKSLKEQALQVLANADGADHLNWLPISTAPKEFKPFNMFVVIALEVQIGSMSAPYTSDPWCVWVARDGSLARWPHSFAPTHWCPLPEYHQTGKRPITRPGLESLPS